MRYSKRCRRRRRVSGWRSFCGCEVIIIIMEPGRSDGMFMLVQGHPVSSVSSAVYEMQTEEKEQKGLIDETYDVKEAVMIPLQPLTVLSTVALMILFGFLGYYGCHNIDEITCSVDSFPLLSDIIRQRYYDRVFIFAMVFHATFVQFANIRAYYQKFSGVFSSCVNDLLYWVGIVTCLCQVTVGVIDNQLDNGIHSAIGATFYIGIFLYFFILIG